MYMLQYGNIWQMENCHICMLASPVCAIEIESGYSTRSLYYNVRFENAGMQKNWTFVECVMNDCGGGSGAGGNFVLSLSFADYIHWNAIIKSIQLLFVSNQNVLEILHFCQTDNRTSIKTLSQIHYECKIGMR